MKLLFIISGLDTGGAEMALYRLLSRISPTNECHVITLTDVGPVGNQIAVLGIPVSAFNLRSGGIRQFVRLIRFIHKLKPDLVHTWMYHANLFGGLASRLAGIKHVVWGIHHNNLAAGLNKRSTLLVARIGGWLSRWLPEAIVYCAHASRDTHLASGYGNRHTHVLANGIDPQQYRPDPLARSSIRSELGISDETPLVGMIGRFDPLKNHRGFMHAASRLLQQLPQTRFVLAGQNIEHSNSELMLWISQHQLQDAVILLGKRDDMPRLMAALDVLALPSLGEAAPNVVAEAMACGIPCVACKVGDSCRLIGTTGLCVAPADMDALADAMLQLLSDQNRRHGLGQAARERITRHYSLDHSANCHLQLYAQLLSGKGN